MDSGRPATAHLNEESIEPKPARKTVKGESNMKAKAARTGKGWLGRKLTSPKFRKGVEEESQKLAIGEQLSRLRQGVGLTQAQVAQRAKTTASAISRYENAEYDRYELRTLQRIVRACGGRLDIILESGPKTNHAA
jgi:hypothetical protein